MDVRDLNNCKADSEKLMRRHVATLKQETPKTRQFKESSTLPKVTVITPSFNQGRFIERTIRSVLNQDWPHIEYIIVDGGSLDNSVDVIGKYENSLAWWVSEKDSGQTNAINKGISRATGKYITWLCSDDVLFPGAIRKMVDALEQNPQAGIVYGATAFIDELDTVMKIRDYADLTLDGLLYHKHSTIAQPSSLIRKQSLDAAGGLDESLSYCMDYDFWIRLHRIAPSINLGKTVFSGYRLHSDSKTVASYTKMALEKIRVNRGYTGDLINRLIYAHYWYIIEGRIKSLLRGVKS